MATQENWWPPVEEQLQLMSQLAWTDVRDAPTHAMRQKLGRRANRVDTMKRSLARIARDMRRPPRD